MGQTDRLLTALALLIVVLLPLSCNCASLQVTAQLNLNDNSTEWLSTSFYGNVYSFLSSTTLWWGSITFNSIEFYGNLIPQNVGLQRYLVVIIGFGFNPTNGHYGVEMVAYSTAPNINNLAFIAIDLNTQTFIVEVSLDPPAPPYDWQMIATDSVDLDNRTLYFLISINHVLSATTLTGGFNQSSLINLNDYFTSEYPVSNTTGAIFYQDRLFIARTGSLLGSNNAFAQIIQINVNRDTTFPDSYGTLTFDHVTYLNSNCYNMFGWGNYLFWQQLDNGVGKLYGWDFIYKLLVFDTVPIPSGQTWGTASGANSTVKQALVVAGDPTGQQGYTAYAYGLGSNGLTDLSQLHISNGDTLPQLGLQAFDLSGLSVLLAGYNAKGHGKITLMRYL